MTAVPLILSLFMICASAIGAKVEHRTGKINDSMLCRESDISLRGLMTVMVVVHHLSQYSDFGMFSSFYKASGHLAVGVFFFLSGHGLMKKHLSDKNYSRVFLTKRLSAVLIPYLIAGLMYLLAYALFGSPLSLADIVHSFATGDPFIQFSWYIIAIIYYYLSFYIMMLMCKEKSRFMAAISFAFCAAYVIVCRRLGFGSWWYMTSHLFPIGVLWAVYEKQIKKSLRKSIYPKLVVCAVLFVATAYARHLGYAHSSVTIIILASAADSLAFVLFAVLLSAKIKIENRLLETIGKMSLEIYLSQGIFIILTRKFFDSDIIFCVSAVLGTAVVSFAFYRLNLIIIKILKKKTQHESP